MFPKTCIYPVIAALLAGCSGMVVMSPVDPGKLDEDFASGKDIVGVIVYRGMSVVEVDRLTQVQLPTSAGQPAAVSNDCEKAYTKKLVVVPDRAHPYRLHYDHGLLESYTFGVTLAADGTLLGFNSVSTPDQGKTVTSVVSAVAGVAALTLTAGPRAACTMTPSFEYFELPTFKR